MSSSAATKEPRATFKAVSRESPLVPRDCMLVRKKNNAEGTMDRWTKKVAVVTGAGSGIGLATAKALVRHGLTVVGLARNVDRMKDAMKDVKGPGKFHARQCDITKEDNVVEALNWVCKRFGSLNILINNAGHMTYQTIEDSPSEDLESVFNVNVMGLLYATKRAIKLMKETQEDSHIININSVYGHVVAPCYPGMSFNVYSASKFAVRAMSENLKNELADSKIRVTSVSPGLVRTNMAANTSQIVPGVENYPHLNPEDLASAIVYALSVPAHVEINEIMLQARSA